jgi:hypothetical protein
MVEDKAEGKLCVRRAPRLAFGIVVKERSQGQMECATREEPLLADRFRFGQFADAQGNVGIYKQKPTAEARRTAEIHQLPFVIL